MTDDNLLMRTALAEAERGRGQVEPNPMVGALVVLQGKIVGIGHHQRFGGPHAEVHALDEAGDAARGATIYVTLEPCCHQGKTPPCTEAILRSGISRVVAAVRDPFPKVAGGGITRLKAAGLQVDLGVEEERARRLLAPFLKRVTTGRPYVIAKWAMTLDGRIASRTGSSQWISNDRSRSLVHEVRGRVDGVVIGIGTALADDPMLTARPPGPRQAARIVLDSRGRLPLTSKLVQSAREIPIIVALGRDADVQVVSALQEHGCKTIQSEDPRIPIPWLLEQLGARGMTNLLVEGGGKVLGQFFDAGEVDEVDVYLGPKIIGGEHASSPVGGTGLELMAQAWQLTHQRTALIDSDVRIQGILPKPWLVAETEPTTQITTG